MTKIKSPIKSFIILILSSAVLLSIFMFVNAIMTIDTASQYDLMTFEIVIQFFYSLIFLAMSITTLCVTVVSKQPKNIKTISYINTILSMVFSILFFRLILADIASFFTVNIPFFMLITPPLMLISNANEEKVVSQNNQYVQANTAESAEEKLMQEEVAKLRHQLKLKKLDEEYLELKRQLGDKTTK